MGDPIPSGNSPQASDLRPTMVSGLIRQLQAILDEQGDMPIMAHGYDYRTSAVSVSTEPCYYDGGGLHPASHPRYSPRHWVRSSTHRQYPQHARIYVDEPETALPEDAPETRDTIDGIPVEAISEDD